MRTEQDKINRKEANLRYYRLEENKEQRRDYMKKYRSRPYVKDKLHEYYIVNKMHWGENTKAKKFANNLVKIAQGYENSSCDYDYRADWSWKNKFSSFSF